MPPGLRVLTIPLIPMKLSKLRSLCDKAIEKYGDMNVGTFSKDYAYDVEQYEDLHGFKLRILSGGGSLPGEALCEEEETEEKPSSRFACIFYED
jgi:hypothetical protein